MTGGRTLAVLGGTGFFGKSFLDAFRRGLLAPWGVDRVIAVARHPDTFAADHRELMGEGVELVALDVASAHALPACDYLVHAANTTDARRYQDDPKAERRQILAAAENFAALARAHPTTRIVYTSSGAVYGAQSPDVAGVPEEADLADAAGLVAYKRDYAEAKRAAEAVIARLGRDHGIAVAVARCFAFVGPYLPRDQHFAVGNFLGDALAGRTVRVNARHPVIRSYMHADDLVTWLMTIADRATPACPVYNVGSDEGVDVAEVARRVARRLGVAADVPDQAATPVDRYVPSIARARRDLGLTLAHDLEAALDATIAHLSGTDNAPARAASDALVRPVKSANSSARTASPVPATATDPAC